MINADSGAVDSEAHLQTIVDHMPAVSLLRDLDGRFLFVNRRYEAVYEVHQEEVRGRTLAEVFPDERADAFAADDRTVITTGREVTREIPVTLHGETRILQSIRFPVRGASGELVAVGGIEVDMTERRQAEAALRAQEEQFRRLIEGLKKDIFFTAVDRDGHITYVSPSVQNVLGYSPEECLTHWTKFVPESHQRRWLDEIHATLLAGKSPPPYEAQVVDKDGESRTLEIVETPLFAPEGDVVGSEGVYRDVTDRKRAEIALRRSEQRLRTILASSPVGAAITREGHFVFANARAAEQLMVDKADLMGARSADYYFDSAERSELLADFDRHGFVRDIEIRLRRADGTAFWALLSLFPISYGGRPAILGWIYDISARKQAEQDLLEAKEQAEKAFADLEQTQAQLIQSEKMASLGQLTAGIAHEIKNPLNFVNNFAETSIELLDELEDLLAPVKKQINVETWDEAADLLGTLRSDLQKIHNHGSRADGIVRSMLLHARGELGEHAVAPINTIVEEALKLAYHGERARSKGFQVDLSHDYDPMAGDIEMVAQEVTRVMLNLMTNAFYAVAQRHQTDDSNFAPTVSVRTKNLGDRVEVRVRDNGIGMPESVRQQLFTPFFTTKPSGEGTGLGLSMSYDIVVQQHGGTIDVLSEPGEYTEFVVTLPRRSTSAPVVGHRK
ncbi:MAG: PAS domain S-box protein [Pseudomonadota bacterium]